MDPSTQDTIAAVATAPGTGAIAVIRISGPQAARIITTCSNAKPLKPRHATLLQVRDTHGRILDEVIATYFQAPASFTGEDVVEISCHGGILVTRRLLERVLACGARPAEPGEFTRRAFEHGKLDLTQAEAIMDVISAGSDLALRAAQNQLQGAIHQRVQEALDTLVDVTAHTTAYIDFPEEEITPDTVDHMLAKLEGVDQLLCRLLDTADEGRVLREGVRTAIVGAPNVGKSSLLNSLLGFERAIVSSTAGTTRDTIEESITLAGLRLRLIDTAGLHDSEDALECAGMRRSVEAGASADLVIEVADATQPPVDLPPGIIGAKHLLLLNKCDLPLHPEQAHRSAIHYSCRTGQGRQELEAAIRDLFLHDTADADNYAAINTRHRFALLQAREALHRARAAICAGESPEYTAVELYDAIDALGSISGKVDTEDILTRVFSTFCLGK